MTHIVTGAGVYRVFDASLRPAIRAIGFSLGPDGRAALFDGGSGRVGRAATGYAIAREMPIPEGPRGVAPRMLKETLFSADRDFGDSTARLALIMGGCFTAAAREVIGGVPVQPLCDAIIHLSQEIGSRLEDERMAQPDLVQIARSVGVSQELAVELAALASELGIDIAVNVKENDERGLRVARAQGFVFDAKSLGSEALSALSSVSVLVADEIIQDFGSLASVLEGFADKRKALVIAARDITGPALATLMRNQQANIVTVAALQPADVGQRAADCLEDLAIATGATLIAERFGTTIERLRPPMLGRAARFQLADGKAAFFEPRGNVEDIAFRRRLLAGLAEKARDLSYDREHLEKRRGRLGNRWCELRISGATQHETESLLAEARAAINAMQSALRFGAVLGGGAVFGRLAAWLTGRNGSAVEAAATRAIVQGLLAVPRQLATNSAEAAGNVLQAVALVQDPLHLTKSLINRGLTLSAALLRSGAIIAR